MSRADFRPATLKRMVGAFRLETAAKAALAGQVVTLADRPELLARFSVDLQAVQMRALLEVSTGAGVHHIDHAGDSGHLIVWNNQQEARVTYHLTHTHRMAWKERERFQGEQGTVPRFWAVVPAEAWPEAEWRLALSYDGLAESVVSGQIATSSRH